MGLTEALSDSPLDVHETVAVLLAKPVDDRVQMNRRTQTHLAHAALVLFLLASRRHQVAHDVHHVLEVPVATKQPDGAHSRHCWREAASR